MMGSAAVFVVAAAYFLLFRSYGFQLEDEGNILFLIDRYVRGEQPYIDFHTGYTPGFYALGDAIYRLLGESTGAVRLVLAFVNAATAAGMYALARRAAPWWLALHAPLIWVAFLPVFAGEFASFNVPYPAWFATLGWLAVAIALDRWQRDGSLAWPAAAGLAAGLAFSAKVNAGAFAIAGATFAIALAASRRRAADRLATTASTVAMALGTLLAFGDDWRLTDGLVHLLPLVMLLAICVGPTAGRMARSSCAGAAATLTVLYTSFGLVTVFWAAPLLVKLGPRPFLREVMLLGSGYGDLYYTAHPWPQPYAVALVLGLVGIAVYGRLAARARLDVRLPIVAGAVVLTAAILFVARRPMPESFVTSLRLQLENAAFWLLPAANVAGIVWIYRAMSGRTADDEANPRTVVVPLAVAMYWQLFPRSDFMHAIGAAPLSIVLAVWLAARVASWWTLAAWPAGMSATRALRTVSLLLAALTATLALRANTPGALECVVNRKAQLEVARVRVCVETGVTDDVEEMAATVAYLRRVSRPGEPVLAFPALAALLFAAERTSPVAHDYWYPGRPGNAQEHEMVAILKTDPPRYAVTLNDGWGFFHGAPAYFTELRRFVVERYRLVGRFGRFDVLALDAGDTVAVVGTGAVRQASASDVGQPQLAARRQAARRWMRSLTAAEAAEPDLAGDTATAVLQLRAIRDGGDLRTAGWILAGYDREDHRVRGAALEAMESVVRRFGAARWRWANDLDPADYRTWVGAWATQVPRLRSDADARVRLFGETLALVLASGPVPSGARSDGMDSEDET